MSDTQHEAAIEGAAVDFAESRGWDVSVAEVAAFKHGAEWGLAYDAARSGSAADGIETWMVDYEHGDGEPQHAVLSWLDDEAKDLPEVGTRLVRKFDYDALAAARSGEAEGETLLLERYRHAYDAAEEMLAHGEYPMPGDGLAADDELRREREIWEHRRQAIQGRLDAARDALSEPRQYSDEPDGREAVSADDLAQAIDGVPPRTSLLDEPACKPYPEPRQDQPVDRASEQSETYECRDKHGDQRTRVPHTHVRRGVEHSKTGEREHEHCFHPGEDQCRCGLTRQEIALALQDGGERERSAQAILDRVVLARDDEREDLRQRAEAWLRGARFVHLPHPTDAICEIDDALAPSPDDPTQLGSEESAPNTTAAKLRQEGERTYTLTMPKLLDLVNEFSEHGGVLHEAIEDWLSASPDDRAENPTPGERQAALAVLKTLNPDTDDSWLHRWASQQDSDQIGNGIRLLAKIALGEWPDDRGEERAHEAYAAYVEAAGYGWYQGCCHDCDWRGPFHKEKGEARADAVSHGESPVAADRFRPE